MTLFIDEDFTIGPKEFQSIMTDLNNQNSTTIFNLAQKKSSQHKIFKRKKKFSYRKNWIEPIESKKERFNSAYWARILNHTASVDW